MSQMARQGISSISANEARRHSGAMLTTRSQSFRASFASSLSAKGPAGRGQMNQRFLKNDAAFKCL